MNNILVYTNSKEEFDKEHEVLVKIQINNSLDLGWSKENILLVTNFDYEYGGIKAMVVSGDLRCKDKTSNKIPVITHLLNNELLKEKLYWYHDFDAFQNHVIEEDELELDGFDLGFTTYGYKDVWNCGSFFCRISAKDIFELLNAKIQELNYKGRCDEKALTHLTKDKLIDDSRYKVLNSTYNFTYKYTYITHRIADKPLKVLHFHPSHFAEYQRGELMPWTNLKRFMYGGVGSTRKPFMSKRLTEVFHSHGIK